MAKVTKTFQATLTLNTEQGGGWITSIDISDETDAYYKNVEAWKNASAGKRWIKAKVQELTPRKSVKMNPVAFDANTKPIRFIGSITYKEQEREMAKGVQCIGKKTYTTPSAANAALNKIWRSALYGNRRKKYGEDTAMPCRTYQCAECRKWHLTSKARGRRREIA